MEYVYASLLLHYAGKEISEENLRKIFEAIGLEPDEVKIKAVAAALSSVNIDEAIKAAALPVAATHVATAPATSETQAPAEERKEEKKEEERKEEEEAVEGLAALFG